MRDHDVADILAYCKIFVSQFNRPHLMLTRNLQSEPIWLLWSFIISSKMCFGFHLVSLSICLCFCRISVLFSLKRRSRVLPINADPTNLTQQKLCMVYHCLNRQYFFSKFIFTRINSICSVEKTVNPVCFEFFFWNFKFHTCDTYSVLVHFSFIHSKKKHTREQTIKKMGKNYYEVGLFFGNRVNNPSS